MTVEMLAAIAALCTLPMVGPIFPVKHVQLVCQKAYIHCAYIEMTKDVTPADALARCVLKRQD